MRSIAVVLVLAGLTVVSACSGQAPPPAQSATTGGKTVDPSTAGTIAGHVTFAGTPPAPEMIKMNTDPACGQSGATPSEAVLVALDGSIQNVFVYIKDGLDPAYSFPVPTEPVVLDQQACRYHPRVFGVRVGQPLEIVNNDMTLHNVHALPMQNLEFNKSEPVKGSRMTQTFTVPEVMVRFKCDVHSWMAAYVGVMADPFFAVTGPEGNFQITGVPPGTYTIEAWHEKFGRSTEQVTIGPGQTQSLTFTFKAQ